MFTRDDIEVGRLVTGVPLTLPVFRFPGTGSGPACYIQASIHGAELQGNAVIYRLMEVLVSAPPRGDVTLVPWANPFGANLKIGEYTQGRFSEISGSNFNRCYWNAACIDTASRSDPDQVDLAAFASERLQAPWDRIRAEFRHVLGLALARRMESARVWGRPAEARLALTLQQLASTADLVLDLHTGSEAARYVYAPEFARESVRWFGIGLVLLIPDRFDGALDEACFCPWWHLAGVFATLGRLDVPVGVEAYTMELGSQERIDLDAARDDADGILNYLRHHGVIEGPAVLPGTGPVFTPLTRYRTLHSPASGLVHYRAAPGTRVRAGDLLAEILSFAGVRVAQDLPRAVTAVRAPCEGIVVTRFASSSVVEGVELYKLMVTPGEAGSEVVA